MRVRIEVPRRSFVKRGPTGRIDFISPVPCPWNYGSIEGTKGPDGEPHDAVVLGHRLELGAVTEASVLGVIGFVDQGVDDPKVIVGVHLGPEERRELERFFRLYGRAKWALRFWRPASRYSGWLVEPKG